MMHPHVETLVTKFAEILDRDPMDQMEDTSSILTRFAQALVEIADTEKTGVSKDWNSVEL